MSSAEQPPTVQPPALQALADVDVVFEALAAPARRQILLVLAARGGSMASKEVAQRFDTTWATTSRHLKALERAGLVQVDAEGRERRYRLVAERLTGTVGAWVARFEERPDDQRR